VAEDPILKEKKEGLKISLMVKMPQKEGPKILRKRFSKKGLRK